MGIRTADEILKKTPNETVLMAFEFAEGDIDMGETISSVSSATSTPTGLTISAATVGTQAVLTISGGSSSQKRYKVTVKVVTSLGQTLEGVGYLDVESA